MAIRRLTRSRTEAQFAGVCAGLAEYFEIDVVFVRAAWVILSIVPGAIIGGLLAYLAAWVVMPEATGPSAAPVGRRLTRSNTDTKVAGICGGIAEYFGVDATPVRLLWVMISIFGLAVVGGVIAYLITWLIIPRGPDMVTSTPAPVLNT